LARRWRTLALWVVVVVVLGVSLAVGAGAFNSGRDRPASLYQRTLQVAGEYRCPVCASESAAASDAPEAVEIRALIEGWLQKGKSPATIRSYLVQDYGLSILEKPPASGLGVLIWALPAVAGALAVAGLGFGFARWRRRSARAEVVMEAPASGPVVGMSVPGTLSGAAQGTLFEDIHGTVFEDAGHDGEPEADDQRPDPKGQVARTPARRLSQRIMLVGGVALIALAGALWLVDRSSSHRLPNETVSGGLTGMAADLEEAAALTSSDPTAALALYDEVLSSDPEQPVALSAEGWIYVEAGFVSRGESLLQKAEQADPTYAPPHLYRALVLLDDERKPAAAIKELKWYLAHGPDPSLAKTARTALAQAESKL
jgi:cytochrome c-type biogenesis protein CcmH